MSETPETTPQPKTIDSKQPLPTIPNKAPSPAADIKKAFATASPEDLVRRLADPEEAQKFETKNPLVESAKERLKKKFMGKEAIKKLEDKLNGKFEMFETENPEPSKNLPDKKVKFVMDEPTTTFNEHDITEASNSGEAILLVPTGVIIDGQLKPINTTTILELYRLYKIQQADAADILAKATYDKNKALIESATKKINSDEELTLSDEERKVYDDYIFPSMMAKKLKNQLIPIETHLDDLLNTTENEQWTKTSLDPRYHIINTNIENINTKWSEQDQILTTQETSLKNTGANHNDLSRGSAELQLWLNLVNEAANNELPHPLKSVITSSLNEDMQAIAIGQTEKGPSINYVNSETKDSILGMRPERRIKPE